MMNTRAGVSAANVLIALIVAAAMVTAVVVVVKMDTTGHNAPPRRDLRPGAGQVEAAELLYDEAGTIDPGFAQVRGLAVGPKGRVYVAGDEAVRVFTPEGEKAREIAAPGRPRTLAVGAGGTMYLAMADHVEVYSAEGDRLASWPPPAEGIVLTSVAVSDARKDVFVAGVARRWGHVFRYRAGDGELLQRFGGRPEGPDKDAGFVTPSRYFDVAVGRNRWLWVVNPGRQRLQAYAPDCGPVLDAGGRPLRWGKAGNDAHEFCGCCNPVNLAILPDGRFVTAEKGLTRVKIYDRSGKFVGVVAGPKQFAAHDRAVRGRGATGVDVRGLDVACDAAGRIFVLDPAVNNVRVFEPKPETKKSPKTKPATAGAPPSRAGGDR